MRLNTALSSPTGRSRRPVFLLISYFDPQSRTEENQFLPSVSLMTARTASSKTSSKFVPVLAEHSIHACACTRFLSVFASLVGTLTGAVDLLSNLVPIREMN
jgi:hypothetical protein